MKKTQPPPKDSVRPKPPQLQSLSRFALSVLTHGPFTPANASEANMYRALAEKGLCTWKEDGSFELTPLGREAIPAKKGGRPIKATGAWAALIMYYGGSRALASKIGCSYSAVKEWSVHGKTPSGPARMLLKQLAREANLADPLSEQDLG